MVCNSTEIVHYFSQYIKDFLASYKALIYLEDGTRYSLQNIILNLSVLLLLLLFKYCIKSTKLFRTNSSFSHINKKCNSSSTLLKHSLHIRFSLAIHLHLPRSISGSRHPAFNLAIKDRLRLLYILLT